jgi:hypothetical protein
MSDVYEELQAIELPESARSLEVLEGSVQVRASFKGDSDFVSSVHTQASGSMCGIDLAPGEIYLFFVGERGEVSICSGTISGRHPEYLEILGIVRRFWVASVQAELRSDGN